MHHPAAGRALLAAAVFVLLLVVSGQALVGGASPCPNSSRYNTAASRTSQPGVINIHLVSHTHLDAGWLKTVDQYYAGTNNSIHEAGVQYIFDSVFSALQQSPDRKFTLCEVGFFQRWWVQQDERRKAAFRLLVKDGRIQWVNGGWVQHDEAITHYVGMVDQMARGHQFLAREFGLPPPAVGWQLDPFGHSQAHASMFAKGAGMDSQFFARIHVEDMARRKQEKALEMVWQADHSLGSDADCFTVVLANPMFYAPPLGFDWDIHGPAHGRPDDPIQDDARLDGYNLEERLADFVVQVEILSQVYQGPDIMMTMGNDFDYESANHWYRNLDRLIHHLNAHPVHGQRFNAFYSTPADYVKAKRSYRNVTWPVKTQDFFPYSDCISCPWTGYFTTRPSMKGFVRAAVSYLQVSEGAAVVSAQVISTPVPSRLPLPLQRFPQTQDFFPYCMDDCLHCPFTGFMASRPTVKGFVRAAISYLQAARQLEAAVGRATDGPSTDALEEAVSLMHHHDAITGTSKQHVVNDYNMRVARGWVEARKVVAAALGQILAAAGSTDDISQPPAEQQLLDISDRQKFQLWPAGRGYSGKRSTAPCSPPIRDTTILVECPLLNVSVCNITATSLLPGGPGVAVVVYNPMATLQTAPLRVPLPPGAEAVSVEDWFGKPLTAQVKDRKSQGSSQLVTGC
mmetsp:Transcript_31306/g.88754  ORF Transcript_31306/g.88754 Transcript_31306/m.88754 type:complete len:682 (-) Transcript_31306:2131-4176(-)